MIKGKNLEDGKRTCDKWLVLRSQIFSRAKIEVNSDFLSWICPRNKADVGI